MWKEFRVSPRSPLAHRTRYIQIRGKYIVHEPPAIVATPMQKSEANTRDGHVFLQSTSINILNDDCSDNYNGTIEHKPGSWESPLL